ncbi:uncharacterized protein LOC127799986 [Diospyros lotus]|uniref:uncharacterized protein LOC127799986 n=1 Tax=Diospyros lotus TaxID=55363 RepID=UPI00224DD436|nr:uncharacterized protein LOC127799986 [Diospyros lotus]
MSHHPRPILTPGATRKRKEIEALHPVKPSAPLSPAVTSPIPSKPAEPPSSNLLLAGYMAYEFLTKGTLLGQKWDPARAEAVPVSNGLAQPKKTKLSAEAEPSGRAKPNNKQSYAEVASLLKADGVHLPGIVNPTQLARWIQM